MHNTRINTIAAIAVVTLFSIGAFVMVERAITNINWMYVSIEEAVPLTRAQ